jgi:hypothetical protein
MQEVCSKFLSGFLFGWFFDHGGDSSSETSLTLNRLHDVLSQMIEKSLGPGKTTNTQ